MLGRGTGQMVGPDCDHLNLLEVSFSLLIQCFIKVLQTREFGSLTWRAFRLIQNIAKISLYHNFKILSPQSLFIIV